MRLKILLPLVLLATALLAIFQSKKDDHQITINSAESHREAIAQFQQGQQKFAQLIATITDEQSFDNAKPELDKIVTSWQDTAKALTTLEPPAPELQQELSKLIGQGNKTNEPKGKHLLNLFKIEERKTEILQWLEEFVSAGAAVGAEFLRLYGESK